MKIKHINSILVTITAAAFILLSAFSVSAVVMSSENYRIEADSINSGGLDISSSDNYSLKDTVGEVGTGDSSSDSFDIRAGYRQMDETYISLTVSGDIDLLPVLGGLSGGAANGNGTWTVDTDSSSGYTLQVKTDTEPALKSGSNNFADYTPASAGTPDLAWDIESAASEFGFSPYNSTNQAPGFKSDGVDCGAGDNIVDGDCWIGLSESNQSIAVSSSRAPIGGESTKVNFRAEINSVGGNQPPGLYTATIIMTAASN